MSITVLNQTQTRSYNANSVSIDVLADALGTLIEDLEAGTYLGSAWSITGGTTDRDANAASTKIKEIADLIATFVADNPLAALAWTFTITNFTPDNELDCNSVGITELANLLATLFNLWAPSHIQAEVHLQPLFQGRVRVSPALFGECRLQPLLQATVSLE